MATTPLVSFRRPAPQRPIVHLYDRLGWSIIPVDADTKGSLIPWKRFQKVRADISDVQNWSRLFPTAGIAVVTGTISGIVVLDADGPLGAAEALRRGIPRTPMAATPSGGFHAYFEHPGFTHKNATKLGDSKKIDIRGDAGYVLAPHTKRTDGRRYTWMQHPEHTPLARAPRWFVEMLRSNPTEATPCGPLSVNALGGEMTSLIADLPAKLRELVLDGHDLERFPSRSECDFFVAMQLLARGFTPDDVEAVFSSCAIGEKYREEGSSYLDRTIRLASDKIRLVTIKYADLSEYDGGGQRLQLCLIDEGTGEVIRSGVTVPSSADSVMFLRWAHLFDACGLPTPIGRDIAAHAKKLLGKVLRIEVGDRREKNPVGAFHRVVSA